MVKYLGPLLIFVSVAFPADHRLVSPDAVHGKLIERRAVVLSEQEAVLSEELGEAIFNMSLHGGWLTITTPSVVEELSRLPGVARRVLRVRLTLRALAAATVTAHCWQHLDGVALNFCDLKEIPAWVLSLPNLTHLGLWGNTGINISDAVEFPPMLRVVELDGCELLHVPVGLACLKFLTLIGLSFNPRELELPRWLAEQQRQGRIEIRGMWF